MTGQDKTAPVGVGYPSSQDVLAELKRRDPARYESCLNFHYTPGSGTGATVEQIADQIQDVDRELANPAINLACRLGGMVFMLEDSCGDRINVKTMEPAEVSSEERMRRRTYRECADLMREAETMLRSLATPGDPPCPLT